jgi:hypothetical protein
MWHGNIWLETNGSTEMRQITIALTDLGMIAALSASPALAHSVSHVHLSRVASITVSFFTIIDLHSTTTVFGISL